MDPLLVEAELPEVGIDPVEPAFLERAEVLVGEAAVRKIGHTNYDVADQLSNLGMEAIHPNAAKILRKAGAKRIYAAVVARSGCAGGCAARSTWTTPPSRAASSRERSASWGSAAWGAGPRASLNLILAGKARAALRGRCHVSVEDIREVCLPILRHRIIPNFAARSEGIWIGSR